MFSAFLLSSLAATLLLLRNVLLWLSLDSVKDADIVVSGTLMNAVDL